MNHLREMFAGLPEAEAERLTDIAFALVEMRRFQKKYFSSRTSEALKFSMAAEKCVDQRLARFADDFEGAGRPRHQFIQEAVSLRDAQRKAFRSRLAEDFAFAKSLEKQMDDRLAAPVVHLQGDLFA